MAIFKAGDKVYFPIYSSRILTLEQVAMEFVGDGYALSVRINSEQRYSFTEDGKFYKNHVLPSIFHATSENQRLLEQLHGIKFQEPPKPPTRREIIEAMLESGYKVVPCWVSDDKPPQTPDGQFSFISSVEEDGTFTSSSGAVWEFATPFDPKTMQQITELPKE